MYGANILEPEKIRSLYKFRTDKNGTEATYMQVTTGNEQIWEQRKLTVGKY